MFFFFGGGGGVGRVNLVNLPPRCSFLGGGGGCYGGLRDGVSN